MPAAARATSSEMTAGAVSAASVKPAGSPDHSSGIEAPSGNEAMGVAVVRAMGTSSVGHVRRTWVPGVSDGNDPKRFRNETAVLSRARPRRPLDAEQAARRAGREAERRRDRAGFGRAPPAHRRSSHAPGKEEGGRSEDAGPLGWRPGWSIAGEVGARSFLFLSDDGAQRTK